jgi:hypothetical protein
MNRENEKGSAMHCKFRAARYINREFSGGLQRWEM